MSRVLQREGGCCRKEDDWGRGEEGERDGRGYGG